MYLWTHALNMLTICRMDGNPPLLGWDWPAELGAIRIYLSLGEAARHAFWSPVRPSAIVAKDPEWTFATRDDLRATGYRGAAGVRQGGLRRPMPIKITTESCFNRPNGAESRGFWRFPILG